MYILYVTNFISSFFNIYVLNTKQKKKGSAHVSELLDIIALRGQ